MRYAPSFQDLWLAIEERMKANYEAEKKAKEEAERKAAEEKRLEELRKQEELKRQQEAAKKEAEQPKVREVYGRDIVAALAKTDTPLKSKRAATRLGEKGLNIFFTVADPTWTVPMKNKFVELMKEKK